MMMRCWEGSPNDRPSFSEINEDVSRLIEHVAGYLDMGFNPFTAGEKEKCVAEGGEELILVEDKP